MRTTFYIMFFYNKTGYINIADLPFDLSYAMDIEKCSTLVHKLLLRQNHPTPQPGVYIERALSCHLALVVYGQYYVSLDT